MPPKGTWRDDDPPTRLSPWDRVVADLKDNAGRWKTFADQAHSIADYLRRRYPGLEVKTKNTYKDGGTRRVELWLRWPT